LGAAVEASNRLAVSMRVLDATSRQTGVPLATCSARRTGCNARSG
jgi:hypothetical protein